MSVIEQRLQHIRSMMAAAGLDAYLINGLDPHGSEYPPQHWHSRWWAAGFSGSAGTVAISTTEAGLWTDFRYHEQAEEELAGSTITLHRQGNTGVMSVLEWLAEKLIRGQRVGIDGATISAAGFASWQEQLAKSGLNLDGQALLLARLWQEDRPPLLTSEVFAHDLDYAGVSREEKLANLRQQMREKGWSYVVVTALDSVAWLLNLRANDVEMLPVALAYLLVGTERCQLFIDEQRLVLPLKQELVNEGVDFYDYSRIYDFCTELSHEQIFAADNSVNYLLKKVLAENNTLVNGEDPIKKAKALKNETEIENLARVMVSDGVALVEFQYWLEQALAEGGQLCEYELGKRLSAFRRRRRGNCGDSFAAIVGYQANGAKPHYRAPATGSSVLQPEGLLLIDSGGQYFGGTTDITRTWSLGKMQAAEKRDYTLVLKAHVNLARAQFPDGAYGSQLDGLARQVLWRHGLDYQHGTGHGVGSFLSVHESPPNIGANPQIRYQFAAGMLVSNEPGLYRPGRYGIRIENLLLTKKSDYFDNFLQFDTLSLCPYDRNLIDVSLLSDGECTWIDNYHQLCISKLTPWLQSAACQWLEHRCRPLR